MSREIEKRIESLLNTGKTKREIYTTLASEMDADDFERFLRNHTELSKKETYFGWNLLLVFFVAAVTFFKLGKMITPLVEYGVHNALMAAWGLLVPAVNLCCAWFVYRYHRLGYVFLFVLSCLALLRPENQHTTGLFQTVPIIFLSGYLYLKLFPKGGKTYL
jgi:hypothetical protein